MGGAEAQQEREAPKETPILKALGLAHYGQYLLDAGKVASLSEIAAAEGMDLGLVSRIARLVQLVPGIIENCRAGQENGLAPETLERRPFPADWDAQRQALFAPHG